VVATIIAVAVAGGADATFRAAAEFADGYYERFLEESALVEVFKECGECGIEHGGRLASHAIAESGVDVP
jgi:hypothetical protein